MILIVVFGSASLAVIYALNSSIKIGFFCRFRSDRNKDGEACAHIKILSTKVSACGLHSETNICDATKESGV